jgi:predicted lipoprotein with Yx(FWY)xxD motif
MWNVGYNETTMNKKVTSLAIIIVGGIVAAAFYFDFALPFGLNRGANWDKVTIKQGLVVGSGFSPATGYFLVGKDGRTLYTSDKDGEFESRCNGECAATWIPFEFDNQAFETLSDPLTKSLNVFSRSNGMLQYAFGGKPLYYYAGDAQSGTIKGDEKEKSWHIILLDPNTIPQ